MSIAGILAILRKDLLHAPRNFFFIQALITPVLTTLLVAMLFGSAFSGKPTVGLYLEGESELLARSAEIDYLHFTEYPSLEALKAAVRSGRLDVGMAIAPGFDQALRDGQAAHLKSYSWGEALLKDRALIFAGVSDLFLDLAGREVPVEVKTVTLGDVESKPWAQRFVPLLVLLAIVMNGFMIPASAMVDEKQRQTLAALTVTPISYGEVVLAKCILGFFVSLVMGLLILLMNNALGQHPGPLLVTLAMAAAFTSACGGLLGVLVKSSGSFMNLMKGMMLLLYAPGILALFPQVPEWVGKLFPTYYVFAPVLEVSQRGASLGAVAFELVILAALIAVMVGAVTAAARRGKLQVA